MHLFLLNPPQAAKKPVTIITTPSPIKAPPTEFLTESAEPVRPLN